MVTRKRGHYWVREKNCDWDIAFWSGEPYGFWTVAGNEWDLDDTNFVEIDETPITRNPTDGKVQV